MEQRLPKIPLEFWSTFKAVVDCGSFAAAAEALHKSQSSISYAIARLNRLLPAPVLTQQGRKARLTAAGEVLYRHAERLLAQAGAMEDLARAMAMEFEAEVVLALDVLLEIGQITCALENFSRNFPHTRVRVLETSLSGTVEALLEKQADLVIGGNIPPGFQGIRLTSIQMLPVAAPDHPLFRQARIEEADLRRLRQVVLRDTGQRRQRDAGWLEAEQRWTVSHFSSSIRLIQSGLAFGLLPRNWISRELEQGTLREIPLEGALLREVPLYLMYANREAAGPATRALGEQLRAGLSG